MLLLLLHPFNGFFPGQPGKPGTTKVNHSGFYWILVTVASAGPYANHLQLTPDKQPRQHLTGRMPFLLASQKHQSTEGFHIAISINIKYYSKYSHLFSTSFFQARHISMERHCLNKQQFPNLFRA